MEVRHAAFDADLLLSMSGTLPRFSFAVGIQGDIDTLGTRLTNSNASYSCGRNGFLTRLNQHAQWCNLTLEWTLLHSVAETHGYEIPSGDGACGLPIANHKGLTALLCRVAGGQELNHLSDPELEDELTLTVLRCLNGSKRPTHIEPRRRWLLVHRVIDFIQAEYSQPITVTELCLLAGVGERSLQYVFRDATGLTVQQYLMNFRLHQARSTLTKGKVGRVSDAARACGIPHLGRFAQYYRRMYGQSPRETLLSA